MADTEEKLLDRVRVLLERAEHPNTPAPEADLCRSRANRLMIKNAIDEALVWAAASEKDRKKPVHVIIPIAYGDSSLQPYLRSLVVAAARYNRCAAARTTDAMHVFGFQEDAAWAEMLYMQAYTTLVTRLHPTWDESLGYEANIYNFKVAGGKWRDINDMAMRHGHPDARAMKMEATWSSEKGWHNALLPQEGKYGKLFSAYRRHAKAIGDTEPVSTQKFEAYRLQYLEGFVRQFNVRLRKAEAESQAEVASSGAEIVLRDARVEVWEAMYETFPSLRPLSEEEVARQQEEMDAIRRQAEAERAAFLAAMTEKQRSAFLEKEQREADRREQRWNREYMRQQERMHETSGANRGRAAANSVNINRHSGSVGDANKKGLGR